MSTKRSDLVTAKQKFAFRDLKFLPSAPCSMPYALHPEHFFLDWKNARKGPCPFAYCLLALSLLLTQHGGSLPIQLQTQRKRKDFEEDLPLEEVFGDKTA